jgi:hypothetical protein
MAQFEIPLIWVEHCFSSAVEKRGRLGFSR